LFQHRCCHAFLQRIEFTASAVAVLSVEIAIMNPISDAIDRAPETRRIPETCRIRSIVNRLQNMRRCQSVPAKSPAEAEAAAQQQGISEQMKIFMTHHLELGQSDFLSYRDKRNFV
jgi:hypothetical protein